MIGDRVCRWRWTAQHGVPAHHVSRIYESALAKRRIAFDIFYPQIQGSRHSVQSQQRTSELKPVSYTHLHLACQVDRATSHPAHTFRWNSQQMDCEDPQEFEPEPLGYDSPLYWLTLQEG